MVYTMFLISYHFIVFQKHFGNLHKNHKRRGSNDGSKITRGLPWGTTKTINIDENDNIHHDDVFITKTPDGKTRIGLNQVLHIQLEV